MSLSLHRLVDISHPSLCREHLKQMYEFRWIILMSPLMRFKYCTYQTEAVALVSMSGFWHQSTCWDSSPVTVQPSNHANQQVTFAFSSNTELRCFFFLLPLPSTAFCKVLDHLESRSHTPQRARHMIEHGWCETRHCLGEETYHTKGMTLVCGKSIFRAIATFFLCLKKDNTENVVLLKHFWLPGACLQNCTYFRFYIHVQRKIIYKRGIPLKPVGLYMWEWLFQALCGFRVSCTIQLTQMVTLDSQSWRNTFRKLNVSSPLFDGTLRYVL